MTERRWVRRRIVIWLIGAAALTIGATLPIRASDAEFFEKRIRPVLVEHCYECHSASAAERGKLKAGLMLDSRDGLRRGGESGGAVEPGRPEASLLMAALRFEGLEMPPAGRLPDAVIADFEQWIRSGAFDPRETPAAPVKKRGMSVAEGKRFWSFLPPRRHALPAVTDPAWPRQELDWFVLARQDREGLRPTPDADRRTLVRRLYYDLLGLPPTPDEMTEFLNAPGVAAAGPGGDEAASEVAYAQLVDRLLASPHFGERWGRHWLDVARYADSNGRDRNVYFYHAWRYRNYVIASFNGDKPQDEFVREQVAGDLLPYADESERDEHRIATAFLALGAKAFEEQKPEVFRMDVIDEQIELIGRTILGLSIGCARCHDHKFDPIPTADYYALAGIFRSSQPLYGYGPKGIKSNEHAHTELQPVGKDADRLGPAGLEYLARLHELTLVQNTARSDRYRIVRRVADARLRRSQPGAEVQQLDAEIARMEAEIKEWDVRVKAAENALQAAMDAAPPQPGWTMAMRDRVSPEDCRIHIRGDTGNLGDMVPRGMLQVVSLPGVESPGAGRSGRRELAEWLAHRDNPLTARVMANRIWMHLFGRGLVASPDDFGVSGARPSHPELLDHLASRFMDDGWSVKRLIRSIVLSRTYRMACRDENPVSPQQTAGGASTRTPYEIDPDNVFLWHMRPRRLEAEVFRDAIRSVAGTIDPSPPRPGRAFLDQFNPYREDEYRTFKPLFLPSDLDQPNRSVYLPVVRGVLPELFSLFDFASPDRAISQRDESIVPAQSLYLMNSSWMIGQSREAARRLLDEPGLDDAGRVVLLYERALARPPATSELQRALQFLAGPQGLLPNPGGETAAGCGDPERDAAWTSLCQTVFASAEFRYVR